jgi:SAM-dependent methyltransferase
MSFEVSADAYARFMGRYSVPLAASFAELVGVVPGQRALDVGCGPGALTDVLVQQLGAANVSAIDPSESFVAAAKQRFPDLEVLHGSAESLPFPDASYDLVLAQLVVHFMSDPVLGLSEMRRVAASGGVVAANVWDHGSGRGPLSLFWRAVRSLEPTAEDESELPGAAEGHLLGLFTQAGMPGAGTTSLAVHVDYVTFEDWWEPYTFGIGPAGEYVARLDDASKDELRNRCRDLLPEPPFTVEAAAWTVWWNKPRP